ncbi:MAG: aminoacetone oxidase family FAD-binding enzyme [Candidatus Omnitrophica bacterium]|nr:aminoacetone oxidase family FAD-binding enzyme [Candidatus Omnitrophota bacterium]
MSVHDELWDVAVVGAGAAGLYASIQAAKLGLKCILIERKTNIGAKILMSGGTRCNVTNLNAAADDYASEQIRTVGSILKQHRPDEVAGFFASAGVEFHAEDDGRMYPSTDRAKTILDALLSECRRLKVTIVNNICIENIERHADRFRSDSPSGSFLSKTVILASGGLSFPTTGSDGTGFNIAKRLGHSLIETTPSLVPLTTSDPEKYSELAGITCKASVSGKVGAKVFVKFSGSMLFTHRGISGPIALNISRYWLREKSAEKVFEIDFWPQQEAAWIEKYLVEAPSEKGGSHMKSLIDGFVPKKIAAFLIRQSGIKEDLKVSSLTKQQRVRLVNEIKHHRYPVSASEGYAKAEVTAGGVNLKEVNHVTMESKIQPGLFIIGEMLDADGRIGGFNFQWAWSTAATAAKGVQKCLKQSRL